MSLEKCYMGVTISNHWTRVPQQVKGDVIASWHIESWKHWAWYEFALPLSLATSWDSG